ncbi:MAG TPA: DNA repair protein RadC [Kofleriaceae bacterium]|jgi:DNA repair protein RadC
MVTSERPRERLFRTGTQHLNDEELLATVLGSGAGRHSARTIAAELVRSNGGISTLARSTPRELAVTAGCGPANAARIAAAFELGRRAVDAESYRPIVGSASDVFDVVKARVAGLAQEVFIVIGIDVRNGLLDIVEVARGTVFAVEVHPREVFRPLVRMAAAGGVLVHNHPTGEATPSEEDLQLTERLKDVGRIVGIPIVDHVVMGERSYRSVAEHMGTTF